MPLMGKKECNGSALSNLKKPSIIKGGLFITESPIEQSIKRVHLR